MTAAHQELIAILIQAQEGEVPVTIVPVGGHRCGGHVLDADPHAATVELLDDAGVICTVVVDQIAVLERRPSARPAASEPEEAAPAPDPAHIAAALAERGEQRDAEDPIYGW